VYKIKKSAANKEVSAIDTAMTDVSLPRELAIKASASSCDEEIYESPDDYIAPRNMNRYESNPLTPMQSNPSYGMVQHDEETSTVYENFK